MAIKSITGISKFIWGLAWLKARTLPKPVQTELVNEEEVKEAIVTVEPVREQEVTEGINIPIESDPLPELNEQAQDIDEPVDEQPIESLVEEITPEVVKKKLIDYCVFMQPVINITTRANALTHLGYQAWDLAGLDSGSQDVFAPFRCKVLTKYPYPGNSGKVNSGNTFIIGSCDEAGNPVEVMWENGEKHIMSIAITHANNISDIFVGQIFNSGDILCQEGKAGNATGNHVHIEPAIGWQYLKHIITNKKGAKYYVIDNNCSIADMFVILKGFQSKIKNANEYTFREVAARSSEDC